MKVLFAFSWFFIFQHVSIGQALFEFDHAMVDIVSSMISARHDTGIIKRNKIESCQQSNTTFFFDTNGKVVKSILNRLDDNTTQIRLYRYDGRGDLIETEESGPHYQKPLITRYYKTYDNGRLVQDSSSSGYFCKHIDYYEDGSLRQEFLFGPGHRLHRAFWFGVDSLGRINRIIDRDYMITPDSTGRLLSNRTLFYNEKNQVIREEEAVAWEKSDQKGLFCPNGGSATFLYDNLGRMIQIIRSNGPSQKIKYLANGLIAEIESSGTVCNGNPYHWKWPITYKYRK